MLEPRFFNLRVSTRHPPSVIGQHVAFTCIADDGSFIYCKHDVNGQPVRASEWFATRLADHLGLPTAACFIIDDPETNESYFGSRQVPSIADRFEVADFLNRVHRNELDQIGSWPGQFLAMLRAYDMFVDNPDRAPDNFILQRNGGRTNLVPIDYASARLLKGTVDTFPVESERTILVGNVHQRLHGTHVESAIELVERIGATPRSVVDGIFSEMPESWLNDRQRGIFDGFWTDGRKDRRIANLRRALNG
jgi:hypothetical protein